MNTVRSINLILNYQSVTSSGCKEKEVWTFEFAAKTQFLSVSYFFVFKAK